MYTPLHWEEVRPNPYLLTSTPQTHIHTPMKAPPGAQACLGCEAPPEARGVNSCTEGCVMWSQHLRRWEWGGGQRRKKLRVPMDQKKEKGKRRSGHRRRENKDDQKRAPK